jgi:hypothetical protein
MTDKDQRLRVMAGRKGRQPKADPAPAADLPAYSVARIETKPVADTFWIRLHGPLTKNAAGTLQILRDELQELPGVEVEVRHTAADL